MGFNFELCDGEIILDYLDLPNVIIKILMRVRKEMEAEAGVMWPGAKECNQLLEAGKSKKI